MAKDKKDKDKKPALVVDSSLPLAKQRALMREHAAKGILEKFGAGSTGLATATSHKSHPRISTGIFILDYALGGGWARGRINLSWGTKSSSKTTTFLRAVGIAQKMDAVTNKYLFELTPKETEAAVPMSVALVDVEGTFDATWARGLGVDTDTLTLSKPQTAEEAIEIVEAYLNSGYDLVVIDSLAAMIPNAELEAGMDENHMGLQARLLGKMFRKIQGTINKAAKGDPMMAPTVFIVNQLRQKIGVSYGSPDVKPGGVSQDFFSTIEVKFMSGQVVFYDPKEKTLPKHVEFPFKVEKNKVSPPKIQGSYAMQLVDDDDIKLRAGDVDDLKQVFEFAEKLGIYSKAEKGPLKYFMYGEGFKTKGEIVDKYYLDRNQYSLLKRDVMNKLMGR